MGNTKACELQVPTSEGPRGEPGRVSRDSTLPRFSLLQSFTGLEIYLPCSQASALLLSQEKCAVTGLQDGEDLLPASRLFPVCTLVCLSLLISILYGTMTSSMDAEESLDFSILSASQIGELIPRGQSQPQCRTWHAWLAQGIRCSRSL